MRHIPEGTLRRLVDEPFAVADAHVDHIRRCGRCTARQQQIAQDSLAAAALLSRPQPVPDVDAAWRRLQVATAERAPEHVCRRLPARRHWRLVALPVPSAAVLAAVGVLLAGGAAGAVLTTVFAPTRVTPVRVSTTDFQAVADVVGVDGPGVLGGFGSPSGSRQFAFGVVHWTSEGRAHRVASIAAADRATGMNLHLPRRLPAGVGAPENILVQPEVNATINFNAGAGRNLYGKSLRVTAGPAMLVEYGSSSLRLGVPTLATFAMARPTATSSGATTAQLEAFILSRPGVPAGLAQEVRLLGELGTTLPVPTPPGADVTQVDVGGTPGILVDEGSGAASAVIWEDRSGIVHAALGLLDEKDILNVANQLG